MARYTIEYRAWTKYEVEFTAESLQQARELAAKVIHPLQLEDSEQTWLDEDSESWDANDVQETKEKD